MVADEHLCCWMSIQRSNPFVLEEDLQTLLERAPWKDAPGRSGEAMNSQSDSLRRLRRRRRRPGWLGLSANVRLEALESHKMLADAAPWAVVMPEWMRSRQSFEAISDLACSAATLAMDPQVLLNTLGSLDDTWT